MRRLRQTVPVIHTQGTRVPLEVLFYYRALAKNLRVNVRDLHNAAIQAYLAAHDDTTVLACYQRTSCEDTQTVVYITAPFAAVWHRLQQLHQLGIASRTPYEITPFGVVAQALCWAKDQCPADELLAIVAQAQTVTPTATSQWVMAMQKAGHRPGIDFSWIETANQVHVLCTPASRDMTHQLVARWLPDTTRIHVAHPAGDVPCT